MKTITVNIPTTIQIEFDVENKCWYACNGNTVDNNIILQHLRTEAAKNQFGDKWEFTGVEKRTKEGIKYLWLFAEFQGEMSVRQEMDPLTGEIKLVTV